MIWPNLRIGSPSAIGATAILWPFGTRCSAVTPSGSAALLDDVDGDDDIVGVALSRRVRGLLRWLNDLHGWNPFPCK